MHDPFAVRDRPTRAAARPSVRRVQWFVTLGMIVVMALIAVALLGLCWSLISYLVGCFYEGFGGPGMEHHMLNPGHKVLSLLAERLR
jgi:hypothetical protein